MTKEKIISNTELTNRKFKIRDIGPIKNYVYVVLENEQKMIIDKKEIYDISEYTSIVNMFQLGERPVASLLKGSTLCVIDLKKHEILLEDDRVYDAYKLDDRTLKVTMKVGEGNTNIYNIETKEYLNVPTDYIFERSLGNNLYVYKIKIEKANSECNYTYSLVNSSGEVLLKNINGYIDLDGNNLIISDDDKIMIIDLTKENGNIKIVEENDKIIAKPAYHNNELVIIEKGIIKLYTPNFDLVKEIPLEGVEKVLQYEIVSDTLKLWVPLTNEENDPGKHIFVSLKTGKFISHLRLEAYPYWIPKTYIGRDIFDSKNIEFHFYDKEFNPIINITADSYTCLDSISDNIFELESENKFQLLNTKNGRLSDNNYDLIEFHPSLPYGYGVDYVDETMDFFDEDLNVIIPKFAYKKYNLTNLGRCKYFIINDYLCLIKEFTDGYGQTRYRTIIEKAGGEEILDSYKKQCYPMGTFIQILGRKKTEFLNTRTGKIGSLAIVGISGDNGKLDFNKIGNLDNHLITDENNKNDLIEKIKKKK